jgi:hypothetical protein
VDTPEQHDRLTPDGRETIPLAVHLQRSVFITASSAPTMTLWATIREVRAQVLDEHDLAGRVEPVLIS